MRFKKLKIYEESMSLLTEIYKLSRGLPREEVYNLCSQMNRAALSIPSNIAEGSGKNSDLDFARFISIANGSCSELYCQIEATILLYPSFKAECEGLLAKIEDLSMKLKTFHKTLKR